ncbi:ATPase family AAA domain-containing protein 5-like isoform X2 [Portunus trituberculatus]|uniref:ATPase family AAA domain-containing protein 5-like isoform X2 n=1 Tax=Portunus trituberculatus TaxID=210409 RepID=UPI001E1CF642|nr:ATPase family AAA domain-containing protein 5-like isoform X2 [Portunus trituberculatus]
MPLSTAVQDLPHCGRGQRGIDFFFKSSPVLTSPVQEKRDILAYFKRVEIPKDQEDQSYNSSLSNNTDDADCSLFSSEEETKQEKNGKINSKVKDSNLSKNCNKKVNTKCPSSGTKETSIDVINLTDDTEPGEDASAKGQSVKGCNNDGKSLKKSKDQGTSDTSVDGKVSPTVSAAPVSHGEEGIVKREIGSSEAKGKEHSATSSNGTTEAKPQLKNPLPPPENKKNVFTFMMANRTKQTEAGKHSGEEGDCNCQESNDDCVVVMDSPSQECEIPGKTSAKAPENVNPAVAKKKLQEVQCDKEKEIADKVIDHDSIEAIKTPVNVNSSDQKKKSQKLKTERKEKKDKTTDLDSSLQDFDLTPLDKPKRKRIRKPRIVKEENSGIKPCLEEVAMPSDLPKPIPKEVMSNCISFSDYMKSACSMVKESAVKESNELKENEESINKCKDELQQVPDSNSGNTKDNKECGSDNVTEIVSVSSECNTVAKKTKLSYPSEKLDEKPQVQIDVKDTGVSQSNQVPAKVKRKRTRRKILVSSDSEEDFMASKSAGASKKKGPKNCDKPPPVSNSSRISNFFKKINQKENDEEENKIVFTVQADVHAPLDGNKETERKLGSSTHTEACGESEDSSSSRRKEISSNTCSLKKNARCKKGMQNNNLDELNKIELLEQIPPTKPLSKKVLNKVCVKAKGGDMEKMSNYTNNAGSSRSKMTVVPRKGKFTRKGSLSTKKEGIRNTINAGKRLLKRKKAPSVSSEEESSDELFIRNKKTNEPIQSDKDISVTSESSSSSSSSSSANSSVVSLDAEEKSSSTMQSSPEASEDDKENVAHYTSQLLSRPGKLSLRLRRVPIPQKICRKEKVKERKVNKNTKQLKKAKGIKRNLKNRKLRTTMKQKSSKEEAGRDTANDKETITLDVSDQADDTADKQLTKKTPKRGKTTQALLSPLASKSAPKGRLQKKSLLLSKKCDGKAESEVQDSSQRRAPRRAAATAKKYTEEVTVDDEDDKPKKAEKSTQKLVTTKGVKLAPIFCKKSSSPDVELVKVVPLSPSKLKARQEFLNSSITDDVKKQLAVEKSNGEDEALPWPPFPAVSHTQQREEGAEVWNLKDSEIPLKKEPSYSPSLESFTFAEDKKVLSRRNVCQKKVSPHVPRLELGDIVFSLSCMKVKYPDFPVYEVFKAYYELKKEAVEAYQKEVKKEETVVNLDDSDEEENSAKRRKRKRKSKLSMLGRGKRRKLGGCKETLEETQQNQQDEVDAVWHERTPHVWTQIFMPKNSEMVIGNTENVKRLKLWLQEWKNKPQIKPKKRKKKSKRVHLTDDFMVSDESTLDDDDDEGIVSTYLVCGPPGAGKTAAVYALASELGYKVLEVNASSRRQGRQVMSQLAEATQSHSVSNASASSQTSSAFSALFSTRTSNTVPTKENSQTGTSSTQDKDSNKKRGVSLVLFEDIDIVFEEWDEGFMSTVNNLMSTTKRPIILTTSHASTNILSQIKERFEVIEFVLPSEKLTAQYLQLAALANGCHVCFQEVKDLVHLNKGDVRKSLLDLQLLSQSGSSHDTCDCAQSEATLDIHEREDWWKEIFPEVKNLTLKKPNQQEFYKLGLLRTFNAKTHFETFTPKSSAGIGWKEIGSNIHCVLPFSLSERERPSLRYPLQPDDLLLKRSNLWQYESLMCSDDEEGKQAEPVTKQPDRKIKPNDPPEVQKASQSCLESLANMYDSMAQLDIMNSSQVITHAAEIKDVGWWVKQPTAGLSNTPSPSHPLWTPHSNDCIIQEIAHKAVARCVGEVASSLEGVTGKDCPQLCLPCDARDELQSCIAQLSSSERERAEKRDVMSRIFEHLPAVTQLNRSAGLDYLPVLRDLAREDELGAALGRGRRSRRFLSYFLQLGWSVSPEDRLSLANSLLS